MSKDYSTILQIDESGHICKNHEPISDIQLAEDIFKNIKVDEQLRIFSEVRGQKIRLDPFDAAFVFGDLELLENGMIRATLPYKLKADFSPDTLTVDEWDRFHGKTTNQIPFVLNNFAQGKLFDLADEFSDDSVTILGRTYKTGTWLCSETPVNESSYWNTRYKTSETKWDLGQPHPALQAYLPRLKLFKQRVLVIGAGAAHDAAYLASLGHFVTAMDFSDEAIARASEKYGHLDNLKFTKQDIFTVGHEYNRSFDLIFEHTLYCAIDPVRRNELVSIWSRLLSDEGHLLGLFFVFDRASGPPFGGSEKEIQKRLAKNFRPLYWNRCEYSPIDREGLELFVYASKAT